MKGARKTTFSSTVVLAIMLLACLLLGSVGVTGAWFTATNDDIKIQVNISGMGIYLYQTIGETNYKIVDTIENANVEKQYMELSGIIEKDTEIDLIAKINTTEPNGLYVRFKFEVIALGLENVAVYPTLIGGTIATSGTNGFVLNDADKFYYYGSVNSQQKITIKNNNELTTLFEKFKISSEQFAANNLNGQTVKLQLTLEASDTSW